ncbi:MAG TPA: hypothetical protein VFQ61_28460 [Polyangiaceae bacterium]|nr:hypothetical protein [Polyangiaceae bacterium]
MSDGGPFERDAVVNEPGLIGARWWQKSLTDTHARENGVTRRSAITVALGATGALVGFAVVVGLLSRSCDDEDLDIDRDKALNLQKKYGWSFGAAQESVTFDGSSTRPFDRSALARLALDARPRVPALEPYYVPALFESPSARPSASAEGDPEVIVPLDQVLLPIYTPQMARAFRQGKALASLFRELGVLSGAIVVVDLDGPESVAFAAGASSDLEPVFSFGNWPHPRGVVPAHRTLAAAAYFQPLFAGRQAAATRTPLFVLDRQRLAAYSDDASQFDNRYLAELPTAAALLNWGVSRVLYVAPQDGPTSELADLNELFVDYDAKAIEVKLVTAGSFAPDPTDPSPESDPIPPSGSDSSHFYYGGGRASHAWFWHDYPWARGPLPQAVEPSMFRPGPYYRPSLSRAAFSHSNPPPQFGTVPIMVHPSTRRVMGAAMSRSGSWNRTYGSSSS